MSTRAPGSRATCHLTGFNETLPVGSTPKLKQTNWLPVWFFPGEDRPPPSFCRFHQGNRFKMGKMYEALTAMPQNLRGGQCLVTVGDRQL